MRDGWRQVALEEVADVVIGRQRSPKHASGPSMTRYLRAANVGDGRIDLHDVLTMNFNEAEQAVYSLRPGDVLVTEGCGSLRQLGASARWDGAADEVYCFQNTLLRLRAHETVLLPGYLEHWSRWAHEAGLWARIASGTNIFHIGAQRARLAPIDLPPLDEQRRIVDLIASLDATIDAADEEASRLEQLLVSLRSDLISWEEALLKPMSAVIGRIDSGRSPVSEGRPPLSGEPAVLKLSAVRDGWFEPAEAKALSGDVVMPEASVVRAGDVLITRSNTPDRVGAVCRVDDVTPRTYLSDLILRIHLNDVVDADFFVEAMNTAEGRQMIRSAAKGTSGSMRKISRSTLMTHVVPLPDLDTQLAIAALLAECRRAGRTARSYASALRSTRSAVLGELLSGEHEIPVSYDELLGDVA